MHVGHFLTRAARRYPDRPAWLEGDVREGQAVTETEVIEHCRQSLASYKKPQSVEFLPALPKNAYGKVLKRELRDRYWVGRSRQV